AKAPISLSEKFIPEEEGKPVLPPELFLKIISYDCITLPDRMNLRLTCKAMEAMVVGLDLCPVAPNLRSITITQERGKEAMKSRTVISGLEAYVPKGRKPTYKHFLRFMSSRIFRSVIFDRVCIEHVSFLASTPTLSISQFNFNPNTPEGRMNVEQLKTFCECKYTKSKNGII
ncbi:hypothetical protein PMAYCL1PPCAC_06390, partial [Pristionchus mayeri]